MKKGLWKKVVAFTMAGIVVLSQWTIAPTETVEAATTETLTSSAIPEQTDDPVKLSEVQWFDLVNTTLNTSQNAQTAEKIQNDAGETYVKVTKPFTTSGKSMSITYTPTNTVDISGKQYLEFQIYIPTDKDLALFQSTTNASLELTSSGTSDQAEINYNLVNIKSTLQVGWNDIKLALNNFGSNNGTSGVAFEPDKLNFFRIFIYPDENETSWTTGATFSIGLTGFRFTEYDTVVFWDGELSASNTGTSAANASVSKKLTYAIDISDMDYLEFDIYLNEADTVGSGGAQFEFTSKGNRDDSNEFRWAKGTQYQTTYWQLGWNHVKLSTATATKTSENVDLENINFFNLYIQTKAGSGYSIKNIRFTKDVDITRKEYIVDACGQDSSFNLSTGATLSAATHYAYQDASYTNGTQFAKKFSTDGVDVRGYQFVEFDLWLQDVEAAKKSTDRAFELTSSGKSDDAEKCYNRTNLLTLLGNMQNGWNHVKLSLSDFVSWNNNPENFTWESIKYFRIFLAGYTSGMMIDNICFTAYDTQDTTTPVKILVDKVDSTTNHAVVGSYTTMSIDEAENCLTLVAADSSKGESETIGQIGFYFNKSMKYQTRRDISNAKYLEFDLWTTDAKLFTRGDSKIQLLSGSSWDETNGSMDIDLSGTTLTTGWNHVKVELPESVGSKFNVKDVRGLKFYATGVLNNTTIMVKDFYATSDTAVEGTYPFLKDKPADTVDYDAAWQTATYTELAEISDCYTTTALNYGSNGYMSNAMVGRTAAEGNYLAVTLKGGYDVTSSGNMWCDTSISLDSTYEKDDLAFAMQLYIEDVDAFKKYSSAQIELASPDADGKTEIDTNDIFWNIKDLRLKSGWNQLVLPFAEGYVNEDEAFDPNNIAMFRFYLSAWTDTIIAVDDIKIVALDGDTVVTELSVYPEGYWITEEEANEVAGVEKQMYDNGFTMVALPDLQEITGNHKEMLSTMFDYIVNTQEKFNTQFVIGLGDLTWMGHYGMSKTATQSQKDSAATQFTNVRAAFAKLDTAGIRYSNAYGNHDYTPGGSTETGVKDTSLFNANFNYNEYVAMDIYGTANIGGEGNLKATTWGVYEAGKMDNAYYKVNVGGIKYLILALEYMSGSNEGLMEWANKIVQAHPNYNVIVSTHSYLDPIGTADVDSNDGKLSGSATQYGQYIWNALVEGNSNIKMVLCGHVMNDADEGSHLSLLGTHSNGTAVYQYMFNSQDADTYYGGLGVITLMHFSEDGKNITFRYYSPVQEAYYKESNQFTINVDEMAPIMQGDVNDDDALDVRDLVRATKCKGATEENPVEYNPWVFNIGGTKTTTVSDTEITYVRKTLLED